MTSTLVVGPREHKDEHVLPSSFVALSRGSSGLVAIRAGRPTP
jgi:hypothetical protein